MDENRINDKITEILQDIASIKTGLSNAHKRIDENDALTSQIHKLTASIETLTLQLKTQNERMERLFDSMESRIKSQDERIRTLEAKPAKNWHNLTNQIFALGVAALFGWFMSKFGG